MTQLLEKTNVADVNYIEIPVVGHVVVINPDSVHWLALTSEEYNVFVSLKGGVNLDSKSDVLLRKLLINNIVQFKNTMIEPVHPHSRINVYFSPTPYCNLKCIYCYAEAQTPCKSESLTNDTKSTIELLSKIVSADPDTVYFTGGEPLLRSDIFDLVHSVKQGGPKVSILTNGTLINKNNIAKFKVFEQVTISLDGSRAEINDLTRGAGSFSKIVKSIRLLRQHEIKVSVSSVISKLNLNDLPELLSFVRNDLGVAKHNVMLHVSKGRGQLSGNDIECTYEEVKKFRSMYIDFLIKNKKQNETVSLLQPPMKQGTFRESCGVATSEIFIDNNGNVYPCRLFEAEPYVLGNLNVDSLPNIISNEKTITFKESMSVKNIKSCCSCEMRNMCGASCRSTHSCYTDNIAISHEPFCNIVKDDLRNSILLDCGFNPSTLEKIGG